MELNVLEQVRGCHTYGLHRKGYGNISFHPLYCLSNLSPLYCVYNPVIYTTQLGFLYGAKSVAKAMLS